MPPADAAKALDLKPDATPEQIEARFLELRRKLEDKIAKAPTPGLQAKYRESLAEVTTAFETLTLAADSSSLPVASKQRTEHGGQKTAHSSTAGSPLVGGPSPARPQGPTLHSKPKSGGKEFILVTVIALVVLFAGGWFVMKTRAENAEKARVAAEQKAETERQAQLAKEQAERDRLAKETAATAEKERLDRLFITLRSRLAELNVAYDALMRIEQSAERELAELKSQQREAVRGFPAYSQQPQRLAATVRLTEAHVAWLRDLLPVNPAKVARAQVEELLSARALAETEDRIKFYAEAVDTLGRQIRDANSQLKGSIQRAVDTINTSRAAQARKFWSDQMLAQPVSEITLSYMPKVAQNLAVDFPLSREEAVAWMADASAGGDLDATYHLARAYMDGWSVKSDPARAVALWRQAADAGHAGAMLEMAVAHELGLGGLTKDFATHALWSRRAAEAGLAKAQMFYGVYSYQGIGGVTRNTAEAVKWWRLAAAQGNSLAMSWLHTAYVEGQGVGKDATLARAWLLKAVEAGSDRAMADIGTAYWRGTFDLAQDDGKAVAHWRKAAEGGIGVAMANIAYAYEQGRGVPRDAALALEWRQKAARAGHEPAQKFLRDRGQGW